LGQYKFICNGWYLNLPTEADLIEIDRGILPQQPFVRLVMALPGSLCSVYSGRSKICGERQKPTYSVEKLQNFPGGKFICDVTISKN